MSAFTYLNCIIVKSVCRYLERRTFLVRINDWTEGQATQYKYTSTLAGSVLQYCTSDFTQCTYSTVYCTVYVHVCTYIVQYGMRNQILNSVQYNIPYCTGDQSLYSTARMVQLAVL